MKIRCSSSYLYLGFAPASNCWPTADFLADVAAMIYTGIWLRSFSLTNFQCDSGDIDTFDAQLTEIANKIICLKG